MCHRVAGVFSPPSLPFDIARRMCHRTAGVLPPTFRSLALYSSSVVRLRVSLEHLSVPTTIAPQGTLVSARPQVVVSTYIVALGIPDPTRFHNRFSALPLGVI